MILRTPIISESYSPDESAQSDAKSSNNMLGYVALELILSRYGSSSTKKYSSPA